MDTSDKRLLVMPRMSKEKCKFAGIKKHNGRNNDFPDGIIDCDCILFGFAITFHFYSVVIY